MRAEAAGFAIRVGGRFGLGGNAAGRMASADCARLHPMARVAGMGKGDFEIYPCLFGAIFRPAASSLGCENLGKSGG